MSTPALDIPEFYPTQFGINWEHLVQQETSRLKEYVMVDSDIKGKEKTYNQKGQSTMRLITTRSGKTTPSTRADEKRWLRTKPYDEVDWFDEWDDDLLGEIVLPTSETVQSHAMAWGRTCDQEIINALEGTAYTGETGTTANTLSGPTQTVAVNFTGANTGLTLAKLIEAKSILGKNEAYGQNGNKNDQLCMIVSQQQLDDLLLNVSQVSSGDYANVKALVDGEVNYFMGFNFVRTELLTLVAATDVRTCIAYVKSGVKLGIGNERTVHFDVLPQQSHTLQIRTKGRIGATRMQEEKVVLVYCDESP